MRTSHLIIVPALLIVGVVIGALFLRSTGSGSTSCALGACPLSIHESDSGKSYAYGVATRFTVYLDERGNPTASLRCMPEGIIGAISNTPPATPPMYAATFEGVAPGTCMLTDANFRVSVTIAAPR